MNVCLFDIDGTLLNTGGAGQAAMESALRAMVNTERPMSGISTAGRTDRAIVSDLFEHYGVDADDAVWARFMTNYLDHLGNELTARDGLVLPGVVELLERLSSHADVSLGLLTGNFERGAQAKLGFYELRDHFTFGGFGDVHHHRDDVARAARDAVSAHHHGQKLADDRVWVIGDTPADVQCGRAIGANVVAVATGIFDYSALEETQPDRLFHDFSDVDAIFDLLSC